MVTFGEFIMILELHRQGLKVAAIARQLGIDRKTVRKYISRGLEPPTYGPRPPTAINSSIRALTSGPLRSLPRGQGHVSKPYDRRHPAISHAVSPCRGLGTRSLP